MKNLNHKRKFIATKKLHLLRRVVFMFLVNAILKENMLNHVQEIMLHFLDYHLKFYLFMYQKEDHWVLFKKMEQLHIQFPINVWEVDQLNSYLSKGQSNNHLEMAKHSLTNENQYIFIRNMILFLKKQFFPNINY